MSQTPPFKLQDLTNLCSSDSQAHLLSTREFTSGSLHLTSTKTLKSLLQEMDILRNEVDQKIEKSLQRPLIPVNTSPQSNRSIDEEYWNQVKSLELENLKIIQMIRKEEEQHKREKVRYIKDKWVEQVKILNEELGKSNCDEVRVGDDFKENCPGLTERSNVSEINAGITDIDKFKKILVENEDLKKKNELIKAKISKKKKLIRNMQSNLEKSEQDTNMLKSKCKVLEEDNKVIVKEYTELREKFGNYQTEQEKKIDTLEEQIELLYKNLARFIRGVNSKLN